ncbi:MAG: hypothetical protein OXT73_07955 [Bacteroidota bacterium]|nr:hypothetical protein [Bacteroidota bacterium]
MFEIPLHRGRIIRLLTWTASILLFMHAVLWIWHYQMDDVGWYFLQLFDVNEEHNLPTWFSGFNLLVATLILGIVTLEKRRFSDGQARRWMVLFLGFCYLSIDEIAGLHETVNSIVEPSWAWGGLVIALVVGLYFIPFLRSLPRHSLIQFVTAGAVFVGGAVIMELIGEPLDADSLAYAMSTLVEEGMEMFGIILFTRSLLEYMMGGKMTGRVTLRTD